MKAQNSITGTASTARSPVRMQAYPVVSPLSAYLAPTRPQLRQSQGLRRYAERHEVLVRLFRLAIAPLVLLITSCRLDIGVDGFRVDAVPFLYEREGTSCESLPVTHDFLRRMRKFVEQVRCPRSHNSAI